MWNFIKSLLSNRFGIVLATLNVCYFVSKDFWGYLLAHKHGVECIFFESPQLIPMINPGLLNVPAFIGSFMPSNFIISVFSDYCVFTHAEIQLTITTFFIIFQWLFIGWLAKTIAQKINLAKTS